jgi:hypothetical protein
MSESHELSELELLEQAEAALAEDRIEIGKPYKLTYPINLGETLVEEVTIRRRPTVADMEHFPMQQERQTMGDQIKLLSKITGETPVVLKRLDLTDYQKLASAVASFL